MIHDLLSLSFSGTYLKFELLLFLILNNSIAITFGQHIDEEINWTKPLTSYFIKYFMGPMKFDHINQLLLYSISKAIDMNRVTENISTTILFHNKIEKKMFRTF
jgi:hypothetical protein